MNDIHPDSYLGREIIRLNTEGLSQGQTAKVLGISRHKVNRFASVNGLPSCTSVRKKLEQERIAAEQAERKANAIPTMIYRVPVARLNCHEVYYAEVSLPRISCLIDGSRYADGQS